MAKKRNGNAAFVVFKMASLFIISNHKICSHQRSDKEPLHSQVQPLLRVLVTEHRALKFDPGADSIALTCPRLPNLFCEGPAKCFNMKIIN